MICLVSCQCVDPKRAKHQRVNSKLEANKIGTALRNKRRRTHSVRCLCAHLSLVSSCQILIYRRRWVFEELDQRSVSMLIDIQIMFR